MDSQPTLFLRDVHQPFQGIDTVESGGIRIACRAEHPCVIVLNERLFKLVNSYILDVLFRFHEKQKTLVVGNQSTVSAFRFSFTNLFFIRFNLFSEEHHKSMAFLCETCIAVIYFLGRNKTVMVADVLIVLRYLRLDVVKFLIQCACLFGLAFRTVGFYIP